MRTEQVKVFKFEELTEEAKETARQWFREASSYDDWQFDFEGLKDIVSNSDYILEPMEKGNYCSITVELIENELIDSVDIKELDTYRGTCTVDVSYNFMDDVLRHVIETSCELSKTQRKFLLKVLDSGDLYVGSYDEIEYSNSSWKQIREDGDVWSKFVPANKATELVERLNTVFKEVLEDCKKDFEHYCLEYMRNCEEYRNSDEYINESIICNEYDFTEDGERY